MPAKKPTNLKMLDGGAKTHPERINKNEPKPELTIPDMPDWLSKDAKAEWERFAGELHKIGCISVIDRTAFAAYCQSFSRWKAMEEVIQKGGFFLRAGNGTLIPHPAVGMANTSQKQMQSFMSEFGMTPVARSRISVDKQPEKDPFAELMERQRSSQANKPKRKKK